MQEHVLGWGLNLEKKKKKDCVYTERDSCKLSSVAEKKSHMNIYSGFQMSIFLYPLS